MSRIGQIDIMLEIARGNVPGMTGVNKFGENPDSANGVEEEVWDGTVAYTFPTSASITHIRSAVDSAATQGATIEVQGIDTNWDLAIQNVDTNGADSTTEVELGTPLRRVFRMKVLENTVLDQDIWVGATGVAAATANGIIQTGNNQTLMAIYTVPANKTLFLVDYYCDYVRSAAKDPNGVNFRLLVADRANSYEFQLKHQKGIPQGASGFAHDFCPYLKITEKSDIKITSTASGAASETHAGFNGILVNN